jgi:hypothetical protein
MGSSEYYDCSPENPKSAVITIDVKDTIDNTKALFSYLLLIGVHVFIIYFGLNFFGLNTLNILVLLTMVFLFCLNIILYNFGSVFKLFYYKIFGLSGILVTIIYSIIFFSNTNNLTDLFDPFKKITSEAYQPSFLFLIFFFILPIFILAILMFFSKTKNSTLNNKKNLKLLPTWFSLGIIDSLVLFAILLIRLSNPIVSSNSSTISLSRMSSKSR